MKESCGAKKIKLISKFHMTELEISLKRIFKVTTWICVLENQSWFVIASTAREVKNL